MKNALNCIDVYKIGHKDQYPDGTSLVYSNFTPRSARLFKGSKFYDDKVVVFGIQMFIKDYLINEWNESFFSQPLEEVISKYKRRIRGILGHDIKTSHITALHTLGYLPIAIKALPEGTRSPIKIPVLTIVNTRPEFFWLVNYLETVLSTELWKPMTTATIAYEYRRTLEHYAELTGGSKEFIQFQGHDFSARGLSNREDGYKASIGHLTSFSGTDTVRAIDGAEDFYGANSDVELIGVSVPATEHSVMCLGDKENEVETFRRLIQDIYPSGIVSIVSDTWDFWKVLTEYTVELKDIIEARDGKVVFRPDSGDPVDILCGTAFIINEKNKLNSRGLATYQLNGKYYETTLKETIEIVPLPSDKGAVEVLWDIFGGTTNEKGFKTLNQKVGLIYGDSITLQRQEEILKKLMAKGFASDNIVFGVGSYSYQYNTRDTFGFAMKATYGVVNSEGREIFKDPITDSGTKKSAKGLLRVLESFDGLVLEDQVTPEQEDTGSLELVFKDGNLIKETSLTAIRDLLKA